MTEQFDTSQLYKASFADVKFYVEKQQETQTMKIVKHKLLGIEGLVIKHLGLGEKTVKVPAYVVGADYLAQKKQLEEAFATQQVSKLVLPFDFTEDAVCESVEIVQEFAKLGAAFLEISFVIGKEAKSLQVEFDNSFDFSLDSEKVKEQNLAKFIKNFTVTGFDSKEIKELNDKLNEIKGVSNQAGNFDFISLFSQQTNFAENILSFAASLKDQDYSASTDKVSAQLNNITDLAKTENIVNDSKKVESVKSYDDAKNLQDEIIKNVDEQLDYLEKTNQISLSDDGMYLVLKGFKEVFINYNNQLSINLPNLTKYSNKIVRPTVLVAYDIADGNVEKLEQIEADIIARNNIKQISLVPEKDLEVLNV